MSWGDDLAELRDQVAFNSLSAPSDYPPELGLTVCCEFAEMRCRITELLRLATDAGRRQWINIAIRELESAKEFFDQANVDAGRRCLSRCGEYLRDAATNRKHAATFVADASGNVSTTPDHEPAKPPREGPDPNWPRPVVDPTWKPREPEEER